MGAISKDSSKATVVTEAIEAFARGEIVIVTDDDDRENEGDLIVAASLCTPEKMAFIIRNTCGIVCAPLTASEARRLRLDPMVQSNDAPLGTAFTVTVDVKHGLTTGISAADQDKQAELLAKGLLRGLVFATDDVDATFEHIRASGAEVLQEPIDQPYGVRDCAFRDPAGNMVRFNQPRTK